MANIHVFETAGGSYRLVFHVAVPAGNNAAAVTWSSALVNSGMGGGSALKAGDGTGGTITAAELAAVQAGTTLEVPYLFNPAADFEGLTGAQKQAALDALYSVITSQALNQLQARLNRYGLTLA